ncbi:DUF1772 domain-containing protein [Prauserella flavalba]|uniref:DUF1772 domain-containing protein n=1 Tax=Prauserella flavalba TaxID=1477506 RepID=A0A318M0M2_9PSEU|nr:DUF1772 domain-containing protein [Prauserella flavalba]PXY36075.1 hypothetical protein BA062_11565 [Prauserella flavalba]
MRSRLVPTLALLFTGLLAGAFGYGALNVAPTFDVVPLDVRLQFHTALMRMNGPVMQTLMGLSVVSALALAITTRGRARRCAAIASALCAGSFLVTRFGNVPINGRIKVWAATTPPPDHAAQLQRWEVFNQVRSAAAFVAFVLLRVAVDASRRRPVSPPAPR